LLLQGIWHKDSGGIRVETTAVVKAPEPPESEELLDRLKAAAEDATAPVRRPRIRPMIDELAKMYREWRKRARQGG